MFIFQRGCVPILRGRVCQRRVVCFKELLYLPVSLRLYFVQNTGQGIIYVVLCFVRYLVEV